MYTAEENAFIEKINVFVQGQARKLLAMVTRMLQVDASSL